MHPPRALFPIISGIIASNVEWVDGLASSSFTNNHAELTNERQLDCGLALASGSFDTFDGELSIRTDSNTLAYFLFRLLGKLQALGTVPAIDWNKYAFVISECDTK